jgi:alcohol dehydrogenase class IV
MRLLMCSPSTEKFADDYIYDSKLVITKQPTDLLEQKATVDQVIAIGGGTVIDAAKVISKNPVIAVPTTFSGASRTSHSVVWQNNKKFSVRTFKPITVFKPEYLPINNAHLESGLIDCECHLQESLGSIKSNIFSESCVLLAYQLLKRYNIGMWLNASLLAGDAIEVTGTNTYHALSYPLTAIYGIRHCDALAMVKRKKTIPEQVDLQLVVDEAFTYPQINDNKTKLTKEDAMLWLKKPCM